MAFPRLNAFSFWLTAFGGLFLYFSFIGGFGLYGMGSAPDVTWWAYAPLTARAFSPGHGTDYWALALIAMAVVTGLAGLIFDAPWQGIALTFLVFGALPVGISTLLQRASIAWLPRNLFMFLFGQGFVSPAITVSLTAAAALGGHVALADGSVTVVPAGYALSVLLLATGEAWFTGMSTALIAVYRPAWVTTYDVRRYRLGGPRT